jgi:glyoxylase-like metal-dependent hydrolase (beta-lactamase superfamily II)
MPFGPYKNFEHCIRVVSHRKNPPRDPKAYCAWIRRKVEGGDAVVLEMLAAGNIDGTIKLYHQWLLDNPLEGLDASVMRLLTKRDAKRILDNAEVLKDWPDAQIIDDHRWLHMWENTLKDGKNLFLTKEELRKLHTFFVDEMARRGFDSGHNHQTPIKFSVLELALSPLPGFVQGRKPVLLDNEFINFVGSAVLKDTPNDVDLMFRCSRNKRYKKALEESLPEELREQLDFVWESLGPNGPYIPAYELWAIPVKDLALKEPTFEIFPLSPTLPATPSMILGDPQNLVEDSYFLEPYAGLRMMIHRKDSVLMAFDRELEEMDIPDAVAEDLLKIEDPTTFILDGFMAREEGEIVYRMIDMLWWRESQHINQSAETRRHFLLKLPESDHVKLSKSLYFGNRKDAIDYLKGETGPYLLIPGTTLYPNDGRAQWLLFDKDEPYKLAEGADAQIKELVDSGKWESMSANERFNLMTKRKSVEPLYPFAQMKTTKKGYSQKEVFGLKSVEDLAEDLFRVPSKQATEVKIDGFRVQVHRKGDEAKIFTESGHEITKQIPKVVESAKSVPAKSFIVDAEATPYDKDLNNLGRAGAAPAFAKGAKGPVDDSLWAIHVFDILHIDGEDLHNLSYQERRQRLRGIELPIRDAPKNTGNFRMKLWENNIYWATSAEQMMKHAETVSGISGSEGAMFKDADSKYRLSGNTPLWSKMKAAFEIDALIVGVNRDGSTFNYVGAIGPVQGVKADTEAPIDSPRGKKFVKWKGKVYSILGKSFNTKIKAEIGDIIRVSVKNVSQIDDRVYHWFHPQVLEKREDKVQPDPLETAKTIFETSKKKQRKGTAFLVRARFGLESPVACCLSPWIAMPLEGALLDMANGWEYMPNEEGAFEKLLELNYTELMGTGLTRDLAEKLGDLEFKLTPASTIEEIYEPPVMLTESEMPTQTTIDPVQLRSFYDSIRPMTYEAMKLSCGGLVPLKRLKPTLKLQNLFLTYPDEDKSWRYVIQFHVRGLSVHGDFRCQISKSQLIGWTWNLGKSLIKPMLRRTSSALKTKAGITAEDLKKSNSEVSAKLNSTAEGRKLRKALSRKVDDLDISIIKKMMDELWRDEAEPILADPNKKILTQIKHPMSVAWLDYEEEIPAGATGATAELGGVMVIMDKGRIQYGAQKQYFHEYWLDGTRIKNRRVIIRRLATRPEWKTRQAFAWLSFFSKEGEAPYTISSRAVQQGWMPPSKNSALPQSVRSQIPSDRQYWKAKNAKAIRDEFVKDMKGKKVTLKLEAGLQFAVKRIWHKGPEVRRGLPVTRYWLILHSKGKVHDAWDFGKDVDPLEGGGLLVRRRPAKVPMDELIKKTGELEPDHIASQTKRLKSSFDTSDSGTASIVKDSENQLHVKFHGKKLKGTHVFIRESGEMWTFGPASITEEKKAILMLAANCTTMCERTGVLHLAAADMEITQVEDLLLIKGPAIKPGEVLPMDGKPSYFTREGIEKFWPSMHRQPIVVLHGDLKGDVIGFVSKSWFDTRTGWGWIEGIVWHPKGIKLILEKKLPAFSIEVIPDTVWDPEHKHDHVVGGACVGLAVVPKGACVTCTPTEATVGKISIEKGKVYKFGMTSEEFIVHLYWTMGKSTQEIADIVGRPRSTIESWMRNADIPRRDLTEARHLRQFREEMVKQHGGRAFITALGTGAFTKIPRDTCPQCEEARKGGKSRRNYTATLFTLGNEHVLINAPKGIATMLGSRKLKPKYVFLEHIHEDVIGGLHELRGLKPIAFATKEVWEYLRRHYQGLSKQKGDFEKLYNFERRVMPVGVTVKLNALTLRPLKVRHAKAGDPDAMGFRIGIGGTTVWHCSDVFDIPDKGEALRDVDIYIGDGAIMSRDIGKQHASIKKQLEWAKEANIPKIFFTQVGHVGRTHEDLNKELKDLAPNAQALHDGAEIPLSPGNPGASFTAAEAGALASGDRTVIVRAKPYQEYSKQAIYLMGDDKVFALYVEGFPEGPLSAEEIKKSLREEHGLSDEEWTEKFGDAEKVWIYRPRILKKYPQPKECKLPKYSSGPYIHNVKAVDEG